MTTNEYDRLVSDRKIEEEAINRVSVVRKWSSINYYPKTEG